MKNLPCLLKLLEEDETGWVLCYPLKERFICHEVLFISFTHQVYFLVPGWRCVGFFTSNDNESSQIHSC